MIRSFITLFSKHFKASQRPLSALETGQDSSESVHQGKSTNEITITPRPSSTTEGYSKELVSRYFQYLVDEDQGLEAREAYRKTPEYQAMISRLAQKKAPKRS